MKSLSDKMLINMLGRKRIVGFIISELVRCEAPGKGGGAGGAGAAHAAPVDLAFAAVVLL